MFVAVSDPIGPGFVASLARPGGNITGLLTFEPGITGKWLAMLKEIAPHLERVALVGNPGTTNYDYFQRTAEAAAQSLMVKLIPYRVATAADIEGAIIGFADVAERRPFTAPRYDRRAEPRPHHRARRPSSLAGGLSIPVYVADGGLMSYGVDQVELFRQAASYVDRILRGGSPADIPVQAPTKYTTVVNLKTAKALGFEVPSSLMVRADEVIE